jgi:hypothetical protein
MDKYKACALIQNLRLHMQATCITSPPPPAQLQESLISAGIKNQELVQESLIVRNH